MRVHIADNHRILIEGMIAVLEAHNIEIEGYSTSGHEVIMHIFEGEPLDAIIGLGFLLAGSGVLIRNAFAGISCRVDLRVTPVRILFLHRIYRCLQGTEVVSGKIDGS